MLLFIEGHKYTLDEKVRNRPIRDILGDIVSIPKMEVEMAFPYVGYCFSAVANDVVFFLPKVVLTAGRNEELDTVFGASPRELIDFEVYTGTFPEGDERAENYKEFLSTLAIWIYRVLSVYREKKNDNILEPREVQTHGSGKKVKHNTLFDVIIAMQDFNRQNQDYLTFIARNVHSGNNKVQWAKTIAHSQCTLQNGTPIYLNPVNRRKMVNFDEELLIIFYSILNYVKEEHGFSYIQNLNYELIKPHIIKSRYIKAGFGKHRLREIKYKYFSDKALMIWDLCYAFFERSYEISISKTRLDCLLAKDFDIVFETMIDELIGDSNLPNELIEQKDGKIVDHLFLGHGLIESNDHNATNTYYIGDSKYYKRRENGTVLGETSIYKQYTYARNVVQWNVDLFLDLKKGYNEYKKDHHQLRDELTEGYNPIPNFFISARIPDTEQGSHKLLAFDDDSITQQNALNLNRQFENRLFDRDTMLLSHYDVNFLFIVALYGRNKKSAQEAWKQKVREQFRREIQALLNEMYSFHVLQPRAQKDCYAFVKKHFSVLNGKVYRPHPEANYLVLAELKNEPQEDKLKKLWKDAKVKMGSTAEETESYAKVRQEMNEYFEDTPVEISAENGFSFQPLPEPGSLQKMESGVEEEKNVKCVLTGYVPKTDDHYPSFAQQKGTSFDMAYIPKINLMAVKYFMPMVDGFVDGYYAVKSMSFKTVEEQSADGNKTEKMYLHLSFGEYIKLGDDKVFFYKAKMTSGQLHSISKIVDEYMG